MQKDLTNTKYSSAFDYMIAKENFTNFDALENKNPPYE